MIDYKYEINEEKIEALYKEILFKSVLKMHELAVRNAPSGATDELRQRINFEPKQYGATEYMLISASLHSAPVEFGTKPHKVNPMWLKAWARRKLGNEDLAYPVAKKIAKVGTDAHPFFYPAYLETRKYWLPKITRETLSKGI